MRKGYLQQIACILLVAVGWSINARAQATATCVTTASSWTSQSGSGNQGAGAFTITGHAGSTLNDATIQSDYNGSTGYLDRSAGTAVNLQQGGSYASSVTWASTSSKKVGQVWIDFNDDGTFSTSEEVTSVWGYGSTVPQPATFNITIPTTANPGLHRMRCRAAWIENATDLGTAPARIDPCLRLFTGITLALWSGTCVDYKVNIVSLLPAVEVSPSSLAFGGVTVGTSSASSIFSMTGSNLTAGGGTLTVTAPSGFQVSADGTTGWSTSISVTYTGTSLASTPIYVRFSPTALTSYTGNITITGGGLTAAVNVAVTGTGATACTGTPTGGTATVAPSSGSSSTAITLNLTGATVAGGITYQWQSSPDNATWTNVPGAVSVPYTYTGLSANTYFRAVLTCPTFTAANSGSAMVTFTLPSSSCTPTFATSCPSYPMHTAIANLTGATGSLVDPVSTTCGANYEDKTSLSTATLYKGSSYTVTLGMFSSYSPQFAVQIWIDFNDDGTFSSAETVGGLALGSISGSSPVTTITIPATAAAGMHRMRVMGNYNSTGFTNYPTMNPCPTTSVTFGNVRDYKINIMAPPPAATATPATLAFGNVTTGTSSVPVRFFVLNATNLVPASGSLTVTAPANFMVSTDGSTWASSVSIPYTGSGASRNVYVQFNPSASISYSANISITGGGLASAVNVPVSGSGISTVCSGSPSAGTASITPASGGGSTVFTLSLSGATVAGGLYYQWQSSPNGTTWTNIPDAIYSIHTFTGVGATTFYRALVTCGTGAPATSGSTSVSTTFPSASCTPSSATGPYDPSGSCYSYGLYISAFSVTGASGSISDAVTCNGTGYNDRTSLTTTFLPGSSYTASITNPGSNPQIAQAWIDFSGDGTFQTSEHVGGVGTGYSFTTVTFPINVPASAPMGTYRMRIVSTWTGSGYTYPNLNPCMSGYSYGEARDYKVVIAGPSCSGTPAAGIISGTPTNACTAFNATLFNVGETASNGITFQWQSSSSATSGFTNISGATNAFYAPGVSSTMYYRNQISCGSATATTAAFQLQVSSPPGAITGTGTVCVGKTTTLGNATSGGSWFSANTSVATVGSSTGIVTGVASGTAVITYMTNSGAGCFSTTVVTVNALPTLTSLTPSSASLCTGATVTLTAAGATGTGTLSSYNWTGPNGFSTSGTTTTASRTLSATADGGVYSLTVTYPGAGCTSNPVTTSVTVNQAPTLSGASNNGPVCVGATLELTANSPSNVTGYSWAGPVGITGATSASATVPSATMAAGGVYTVTVNNGSGTGCTATYTTSATVNPLPTLGSVTSNGTICATNTITLTASGASNVTGYAWTGPVAVTSSTSAVASVPSATTTATGVYTVTVNNGTGVGCTNTYTTSATVLASSIVYNVTGGGAYCSGGTGVPLGLSGSVSGIQYQLYRGSTPVGSAVSGTGSALSFGMFTTLGTYSVSATNTGTGCVLDMAGTPTISISPVPSVYSVTGGGSYCAGGTGASVNLTNSDAGVTYQLYVGATPVGAMVTGTGSPITFGPQTAAGTYVAIANPGSTCATTMTGSATVTINSLPTAYSVTGGGAYCAGSGGSPIGLSFASSSAEYTLYNGSSPVTTVGGANAALSFGSQTAVGTYSVMATSLTNGCTNNMSGTVTVSVNALPAAYTVTGGGNYCSGGTGVAVGLSNSAATATYQLYNGSSATGTPVSGTGSAISFGNQTAGGVYTVVATSAEGCNRTMTGSATVVVNATPTVFTISSGGAYCAGGSGVALTLSGSNSNVNYTVYNGSTPVATVAGTGTTLSLGTYTASGTYSVSAVSTTGSGCSANMSGTATISINAAPTAFNVSSGGGYCVGGSGVALTLSGSQAGATYQVYRAGSPVGTAVSGTGSSLALGTFTEAGNYTVIGSLGSGCTGNMTGTATITINPLPTAFTVTGGGSYCVGGTGVAVGLNGSQTGVNYFLYNGATLVGSATGTAGTGLPISLGVQTMTGTYTVFSQSTAGCTNPMSGSTTITTNPLPTPFTVTGGGSYCSGSAGSVIGLASSATGVDYRLMLGSTQVAVMSGTGSAITFGSFTTSGTYTATATTSAGCNGNMTGSVNVSVTSLPTAFNVTGGGSYCAGGTGVAVGLSSSTSGVNYSLFRGSTLVSTIGGTGSSISFGNQTVAGTYSVSASSTSSPFCSNNMTGAATITINPTPTLFNITGGGNYCSGGTGVAVGVSGSEAGTTYQLYNGSSIVSGAALAGTGGSLNFGNMTSAGTYSVRATNASSCVSGMLGTVAVGVNALPTVYNVGGGGQYCSGGAGVAITLDNSQVGVNYRLFNGSTLVATVAGTGSALDLGMRTAAGTYSVSAVNATTGCTANMSGSATITVNATPTVYTVSGGGQYCAGGTGMMITLSGSATGISYQLRNGTVAEGSPVSGTGASLSFGPVTTGATYNVLATNTTTGCEAVMTGAATVTVNSLPTAYNVTGGGQYCAGGAGISIGLSGSNVGVSYQLFNGSTPSGSAIPGTGLTLDFGVKTAGGSYTVIAVNNTTGCTNNMTGSAMITVNANPTVYTVTGGGQYCAGGAGVAIGLAGSQSGIDYQLYSGSTPVGGPIAGTGGSLSFGMHTAAGTYTVAASNAGTSCAANMSGAATVSINALPTVYSMTGGGNYCAGGTGVMVGLNSSNIGITYQLYNGSGAVGSPQAGTGGGVSFGMQTAAGSYYVIATNSTTSCTNNMAGVATVGVNALPTTYNVTGGGQYCSGGAGVAIGLAGSNTGISYQLYNGSTPVGSTVAGTGAPITFGMQTAAGNYNVVATNTATSCVNNMTGSATVTVNSLPTVFNVTGGGSFCAGGAGITVGLSGSQSGVNYQLYNGAATVGSPVAGTGAAISFGAQATDGTYTVMAMNGTTSCSNAMNGSATIGTSVLPAAYSVTGGGNYCAGGEGVLVGLGSSNTGITYQLYNGSAVVATAAGTGGAISFGAQTAAGTYSVMATNNTTGCSNGMTGTANVVVNALPAVYTVTGGGTYCNGSTGVNVGLSNSATGITYELFSGSTSMGTMAGTGSAISFGPQTTAGSYMVVATNNTTACVRNMSGAATVAINPSPAAFAVTGGGSYCTGGAGVAVGLSGSAAGVAYQLYNGSSMVGGPVAGTGSALSFGMQSAAGTYSVLATNTATSCAGNMSGTATVTVNSQPNVYNVVSMGTGYCAGGTGVNIMLSGSQTGVSYQLYNGSLAAGAPVAGTGAMLSFGPQTAAGVYMVVATSSSSCTANMNGAAPVTVNPAPVAQTVTGNGGYCAGSAGSVISLASTTAGTSYQLYRGTTAVGSAVAGTGSSISFAPQTTAGTYMVMATITATGCQGAMTGTINVSVNPVPAVQTVTGGGQYCSGGTGVAVGLAGSAAGVNYTLYNGSSAVATVAGSGSAVSFGMQTAAGTYSVMASNAATACTSNMSGAATVVVNALPAAQVVTGGGNYCVGSATGMSVGLAGSATGVTYQLYNGTTPIGGFIAGTGSALDFGMQSASGAYTVRAVDAATLCAATMSGSAVINANAAPATYTVTGGGSYCIGGTGVHVGLDGSQAGISYRLYNGTAAVGSPMTGTGSALDFGMLTGAGTYTVMATNTATSCAANMNGSASVAINTTVTPSVTINTGVGDTVCHGILTTFSAVPVNGGTTPTYQWQVNGVNVGLGSGTYSYLPANGDVVSVQMTSSSSCATPAMATATKSMSVLVSQLPVANVNVTADKTCMGTPVTFSVSPMYGGSAPSFTWMKNGVSVSTSGTSYTYTPTDGDNVYVKMTSNYRCRLADEVNSTTTTMSVDTPQTPIVVLAATPGTSIAKGQTVTITATVTKAGNAPQYQWYINSTPVTGATSNVFTSNTIANNDSVTCLVTNISACAPMSGYNSVVMKVEGVGVQTVAATIDVQLVPNPNKGDFIVRGTMGTEDRELIAEVTDMLGQVIYRGNVQARGGNISERINLGNTLANGMYMLSLRTATESKVFHFVIGQ